MNPIETEKRIRVLELMLYGGSPVRPGADYGRQEAGHFDGVRSRSPDVRPTEVSGQSEPDFIAEQYVVTEDGGMRVERPDSGEQST